jgi:CDP-diacylglycerol--glycerol-3-phosphate 3-phosphatidyltransferase
VSIYAFKPAFQLLLQPHVGRLARAGVTANQVTLAAAIGSVAVALLVAWSWPSRWPFLLIPAWLLVRMALNAMDGMLARDYGQKSRLGAYLNEICDVASDAALYAPFALFPSFGGFWIGLLIVLAALTELAGVLGQTLGSTRRYDGPMGKSDRALAFGALGLWAGLGLPFPPWTVVIVIALALALAMTVVNRVRAGLKQSGPSP